MAVHSLNELGVLDKRGWAIFAVGVEKFTESLAPTVQEFCSRETRMLDAFSPVVPLLVQCLLRDAAVKIGDDFVGFLNRFSTQNVRLDAIVES